MGEIAGITRPGDGRAGKLHLPGLNGLRFYAALLVVVSHLEVAKHQVLGVTSLFDRLPIALDVGSLAVRFFFVLSGFLITLLLLVEHDVAGTIAVGRFYARRALRILPLYYLILLLAFTVFPHFFPGDPLHDIRAQPRALARLLLYASFLPNVGLVVPPIVPGAGHLWSIGVEEQFYWIWPAVVRSFRDRLPTVLIVILVGKMVAAAAVTAWLASSGAHPGLRAVWAWTAFPIEHMAIGALGAEAVFSARTSWLRVALHPWTERAIWFVLLPAVFPIRVAMPTVAIGAIFLVAILNVACNPRSLVRLDDRFHRAAGEISYGVYMFHPFVLYAVLAALRPSREWMGGGAMLHAVLYASVLGLTYAVAWLSRRTFEDWFLRHKERFAVVQSSPAG